ncbi:pantoate--beta-alanine ligase [Aquimarina sp. BL5]|uniref:pantoate--beta-alanine ligase n=1 Tax=Aquimarina sp. BL5 TaxID=1714860 RepID=UPI000E4AAF34|nr:pantoate--beta-alanine ligase [Aquimarina sp. BL5]AXT52219.1 pantoate--beta-alanine ligase [Aquimarina sp. BL5]RKN05627.1 pantoate--beta-alanine ligase [Aquimarina sp. BL5]
MRVYEKRLDIERDVADLHKQNKSIGFVPTMGALHHGHLALVQKAIDQNQVVIVSIFVNPTQFNNSEDLVNYPRTLDSDVVLLSNLSKAIIVFAPKPEEIYGSKNNSLKYDFNGLEHEMEGRFRPGHFDGVGTVLKHLFTIVSPTKAYFGEKDFQQLQIVKKLVEIEKMSVKIIGCPIYREDSGLALSSRNKRLNKKQLQESPLIYKTLKQVKNDFGTKSVIDLIDWVSEQFKSNETLELEYFEIAKVSNLKSIKRKRKNTKYRAFIAVFAGEVRLIDNIALN